MESFEDKLNNCILDQVSRRDNWFYHGFWIINSLEIFKSIYHEGIKCDKLLDKPGGGYNGVYYISLSKIDPNAKNSSYIKISCVRPSFIIDGIKPIKAKFKLPIILDDTILPFRDSEYDDEYQKFWRIKPKNIIGLQYYSKDIEAAIRKEKDYLKYLAQMLDYLLYIESDFPFFTFDEPYGDLYLMDKEKTRDLLLDSLPKTIDNSINKL